MTVHRNRFFVNKTNRCTEFLFYFYYDSMCFGQPFCPLSGVLSSTSTWYILCTFDDRLLQGVGWNAKVQNLGCKKYVIQIPPQKDPEFLQVSYKFDDFDIQKVVENIFITQTRTADKGQSSKLNWDWMLSNMSAYKRHGTKFYREILYLTSCWHNICNGNLTLDLKFWMSAILHNVDQIAQTMQEGHKISVNRKLLAFRQVCKERHGFPFKRLLVGYNTEGGRK